MSWKSNGFAFQVSINVKLIKKLKLSCIIMTQEEYHNLYTCICNYEVFFNWNFSRVFIVFLILSYRLNNFLNYKQQSQ
jgi:hypothetical protein